MSSEETINIPDLVDEMDHFLIWQIDEIFIIGFGLIIGIVINSPMLGFVVGLLLKSAYSRSKQGKPKGYFLHRLRDIGILPDSNSKLTPMEKFKKAQGSIGRNTMSINARTSYQSALVDKFIQ